MTEKHNKILIIDDDEIMRTSLTDTLSTKKFVVDSTATAEKALRKLKKQPFNLLLIDIKLPNMSGIELLKKLDIKNSLYEAIIISAYADIESAKEAMELGAFSYIAKPFRYKDLAPLVRKALEMVKLKEIRNNYMDGLERKVDQRTRDLEKEIIERKKAHEIIRESEAKYSTLVEQSKNAVLILQDGACVYANKATTDITGYTKRDLTGEKFWNFIAPESRELVKIMYKKRLAGKKAPTTYEVVIKHKNGCTIYGEITGGVIQYKGRPAIMGTLRDITDQKIANGSIKESEEKYRSIFETAATLITSVNEKGIIVDCNQRIKGVLGYEKAEIIGKSMAKIIHPDYHKKAQESLEEIISKGVSHNKTYKMVRKDGRLRDVNINSAGINANGSFGKTICIIEDITEQKINEQKLHSLASMVEQSLDSIIQTDTEFQITYMNKTAEKLFGWKLEEVIGKSPAIFNAEPLSERIQEAIYKTVSSGEPYVCEEGIENIRKDGSVFICRFKVSPILGDKRKIVGYMGSQTDITAQKRAEQEIMEKEKKLSEKNRMLYEKNIALREVMEQLEIEKEKIGRQVTLSADRFLFPLISKLKGKGSQIDKAYLELLEDSLKELTSQFGSKLSDKMLSLTQKEVEISNMIKSGLTSKEIAKIMNISHRTVETHRNNIRKKLGIGKKEVNLETCLKNL